MRMIYQIDACRVLMARESVLADRCKRTVSKQGIVFTREGAVVWSFAAELALRFGAQVI